MRVAVHVFCLVLALVCEGSSGNNGQRAHGQPSGINFCNIRCSHPHCSDPCQNGGTCVDGTGVDSFTCACAAGYTGDTCDMLVGPRDCFDIQQAGNIASGLYDIYPAWPASQGSIEVYCDMETDGGGWLVFQRRKDGSEDFFLDWDSYKQGFGNRDSEFWLGNDNIFAITNQDAYELRVDMEDNSGNSAYAYYSQFRIEDETANYRLTVSGYDGTAGDSLAYHDQYPFSTKDRNNVQSTWRDNCADAYNSAWWYNNCYSSNLNGVYGASDPRAIVWYTFSGGSNSLKSTEMKIRPVTA
ncbi:ryncolin-1-like [Amphiura filiformis]|uniref:ryncolin-1-like n=1 Tax=Amphiura filiformis TaxID=82378 RepID=UPI003B2224B7